MTKVPQSSYPTIWSIPSSIEDIDQIVKLI